MATIRKLASGKWQAIVRRKGWPNQSKTFLTRQGCSEWARSVESGLDRGVAHNGTQMSLHAAIDRYIAEVVVQKRGVKVETQRLLYMKRQLPNVLLAALQPARIAAYRDERAMQGVAGSTIVRELNNLSHVIQVAMMEWGVALASNPVKMVRKPQQERGRDRRISAEELKALQGTSLRYLVTLAVETGMRLGELLSLRWQDVSLEDRTATLHTSKNGEGRVVPLSPLAMDTLKGLVKVGDRVFYQWKDKNSVGNLWRRSIAKLQNPATGFLVNLRFHDLRHEAASRLFEKGLNVMEVASITGHKSLAMLKRYTHLKAADLALKLAA